jgi:uroporphyrinogen-III synthase
VRVLVTRPRRDAEKTAARLAALGHIAVIAPVMRIVATRNPLPSGPFDAVIATSSNAIEHLDPEAVAALRDKPLFCVGARAATLATARGLNRVDHVSENVAKLVEAIRDRNLISYLYLAGQDRKAVLEKALMDLGRSVTTAVVYNAIAEITLPENATDALRNGAIDVAISFSRRSAELLISLCEAAGVGRELAATPQLCVSDDAAAAFSTLGARVIVASQANSDGLFEALDSV